MPRRQEAKPREATGARTDRDEIDQLARHVVDAAIAVHTALGPGLLESTYEACLADELRSRGLAARRQLALRVVYRGMRVGGAYRLDIVVDGCVVVELKTVTKLHPVHEAQLLSYLRLGDYRLGFLINFHVPLLKDGIRRMANRF